MVKILVTGAAGFIGFHLCLQLAARGDCVLGYDNFNDYYDPALKEQRSSLLKEKKIDVLRGDIVDLQGLKELVQKEKITHIIHLAAQAGVRYSLQHPEAYSHSNLDGFISILELCRAFQLPLVYASSSSVYGLNAKVPFSEGDRVDEPVSLYAATKRSNELMAFTYHHLYHFPVTGLRFFTVYGPWGRPDMAYYSFTKSIIEGKSIQVFNQGKLQRDFTYIDDIVEGIVAALDKQYPCEIFNLGNNKPAELSHFIALIEKATGRSAKKEFLPMQPGDVLTTYADLSKSERLLGYQPRISLEEGIPRFVEWYYSNHSTFPVPIS